MSHHETPPAPAPEGKVWICRRYITVRGKRIYAHTYGKQAFCFWVNAN